MNSVLLSRTVAFLFATVLLFSPRLTRGDDDPGSAATDYKLTPGDLLSIAVVGERDLLQDCRVSSTGTITYQWLKKVPVAGKTVVEVEQMLGELLDKDYLVDPTVLVAIKDYRLREVTVNGHVGRPGAVAIPAEQPLTLAEAIGRAGGLTPRADKSKIMFMRRGMKEPERLNWDKITKENDPKKIIYVQPGDVIDVKETIL